jgi:hypothetical protein
VRISVGHGTRLIRGIFALHRKELRPMMCSDELIFRFPRNDGDIKNGYPKVGDVAIDARRETCATKQEKFCS